MLRLHGPTIVLFVAPIKRFRPKTRIEIKKLNNLQSNALFLFDGFAKSFVCGALLFKVCTVDRDKYAPPEVHEVLITRRHVATFDLTKQTPFVGQL
jgi:hypothetical protein